jgi:formate hydrogenlyase subunit 4
MIIQMLTVIILAPAVNGIIRQIKAKSQHRKGSPILQLYFDLFKLFKKDIVISSSASWIFRATPYIYFIVIIISALFIPVIPQLFSFNFIGDAIFVVYLMALGRFFIVLSGLDTGSTFGGMGSSREMVISSLIEPSLIVAIFTLGLNKAVGTTNFSDIYSGSISLSTGIISPVYFLLLCTMMIVLIAETARIPVDDPSTHLELTMVHEAMILEYSGRYLALIELASSIKQLLFITLIANIFIPFGSSFNMGPDLIINLVFYILKVAGISIVVGIIEINSVKLRLFSVPNLAALAFILSILSFMTGSIFGR